MLVILAILAAIMIPALTGWIDKAKEKQVMLDARNFEMAAQAALYQDYADEGKTAKTPSYSPTGTDKISTYINNVIGDTAKVKIDSVAITTDEKGTITKLVYKSTDKYTATYEDGWKIETTLESSGS